LIRTFLSIENKGVVKNYNIFSYQFSPEGRAGGSHLLRY